MSISKHGLFKKTKCTYKHSGSQIEFLIELSNEYMYRYKIIQILVFYISDDVY